MALALLCVCGGAWALDPVASKEAPADELWQRSVTLVEGGDFEAASNALGKLTTGGPLIQQVNTWLTEYDQQEHARRDLDQEDFEKYVGYAERRIEREEYKQALDWVLAAQDVAADRDKFIETDWVVKLAAEARAKAEKALAESDYETVLGLAARLTRIFERDSYYRKLQRESVTHLRLEAMFEDDYDWRERMENVRWQDAQRALEYVDAYYVEPPDYREIAVRGLEQLLLLSESKTAQAAFERLGNADDRADFQSRLRVHVERLREMGTVTRSEVVSTFRRAVRKINPQTVDLPEELVVSELMRGAFEPLDDFTTVIWPKDFEDFEKHTRGDFIGVGVSIIMNAADEVEVVSPLDDSSAYRAGVQAGDVVTKVNGKSIKGLSLTRVVDTITGPEDTPVTLTIRRGGKDLEFELLRTRVKIQSVKGYARGEDEHWDYWIDEPNRVGYIFVSNFQKNTPEDVFNVVRELQEQGLKGLIIDVRGNPGGLLSAAFDISSLFLEHGDEVVSTRGRLKTEDNRFKVGITGPFAEVPLVVLVDESSASASEILAGAIRDNRRGIVVGARTFGKFSVQNLIPLSPTTNAALKVTTARYYLPGGDCLHRDDDSVTWGVEPDIPVRLVWAERINVLKVRRERDRLGPPPPPKEVTEEGKSAEGSDQAQKSEGDAPQAAKGEAEQPAEKKVTPAGTEGEPSAAPADKAEATPGEGEAIAQTDAGAKKDELPPLEEPDENNRPEVDPQLDTALLVMRVQLLGARYPTLADAKFEPTGVGVKP